MEQINQADTTYAVSRQVFTIDGRRFSIYNFLLT